MKKGTYESTKIGGYTLRLLGIVIIFYPALVVWAETASTRLPIRPPANLSPRRLNTTHYTDQLLPQVNAIPQLQQSIERAIRETVKLACLREAANEPQRQQCGRRQ